MLHVLNTDSVALKPLLPAMGLGLRLGSLGDFARQKNK